MFEAQKNANIYVWMLIDGLNLFVPQDDVQSVEIISDIDESETPIGAIGWWQDPLYEQSSPIFCLTKDLHLSRRLRKLQEYFVLLKDPDVPVGITCEKVEHLDIIEEHLNFQILPPIMKTEESPITQLLMYKNKVACVCLGADLINYLARQSTLFEHKKRHD